jgi:hypothetical protein
MPALWMPDVELPENERTWWQHIARQNNASSSGTITVTVLLVLHPSPSHTATAAAVLVPHPSSTAAETTLVPQPSNKRKVVSAEETAPAELPAKKTKHKAKARVVPKSKAIIAEDSNTEMVEDTPATKTKPANPKPANLRMGEELPATPEGLKGEVEYLGTRWAYPVCLYQACFTLLLIEQRGGDVFGACVANKIARSGPAIPQESRAGIPHALHAMRLG